MCGITGFIDFNFKSSEYLLKDMVNTLHHRGPDDRGHYFEEGNKAQIGLGHTRLSIIDLTQSGHQPMYYLNFVIIYNGEVYNFKEIKKELVDNGETFISDSDTEVILKSFAKWGLKCVERFRGMFAFVILDKEKNQLYICRDRVGVKPMYYYWFNDLFLFASELKAFHKHPSFEKKINEKAVYSYFQCQYIPGPDSIFQNCFKLEPGHWMHLNLETKEIKTIKYWDIREFYKKPLLKLDYNEAKDELEKILIDSCNYRMVADVSVGVFLSGGYDSSFVTAVLQKNKTEKLKTFTIGFPDGENEAPFAKEIANYLGTNHTEFDCSLDEAKKVIPELPYYFDEPFADISAIPTIMVSRLARESVTVALAADGGDELFAGYNSYPNQKQIISNINLMPRFLQKSFSQLLKGYNQLGFSSNIFTQHKLEGIAEILNAKNEDQLLLLSEYKKNLPDRMNNKLFKNSNLSHSLYLAENPKGINDKYNLMLYLDFIYSLRDQLLVKSDRATMAASIEGREPLLDHVLAEFAAQLPMSYKMNGKDKKIIFKDIIYKYIEPKLLNRPKIGFDLPIYDWLNADLSYLIDEYLNENKIKQSNIFNYDYVNQLVIQFKDNKLIHKNVIWKLIQFQMWYEMWMA